MKRLIGVYGASGFGREVMPIVRSMVTGRSDGYEYELAFIDDTAAQASTINGQALMQYEEFRLRSRNCERFVAIAIANSKVREQLAAKILDDGVQSWSVQSDSACFLDENHIGEGSIFCAFTHVTSNVRIGRYFHANIYSYVAHDCVIGDFVTLAPGAKINGNVEIQDHAYIGTGAVIKQGTPSKPLVIGKGAIVGMGAVVTKDVAPGAVVAGNPARPM